MAKIIDYLMIDGGYVFVPDKNQKFITIIPGNGIFKTGGGKAIFAKGDSFILASYGIMFPESFTMWQGISSPCPSMGILGYAGGAITDLFVLPCFLQNITDDVSLFVTMENREHEIMGYCDFTQFKKQNGESVNSSFLLFNAFHNPPRVSMINCPDDLDGVPQYCFPFVKVYHNLPLT